MDPLTLGISAVGLGMQLFGGISGSEAAQKSFEINQQIARLQKDENGQRQKAMELSAKRSQMENFRNVQRARAAGTNAAVNQGASMGSGLQGGLAQASDQGGVNNLGITQNLEIGRNIFGIDNQISDQKAQLSGAQSDMATAQGFSAFGQGLTSSAGTLSNIAGAFGSPKINLSGIGFNPIRGVTGA